MRENSKWIFIKFDEMSHLIVAEKKISRNKITFMHRKFLSLVKCDAIEWMGKWFFDREWITQKQQYINKEKYITTP